MREQPAFRKPKPLRQRADGQPAEPLHARKLDGFIQDARPGAVAFCDFDHAGKIARPFVFSKLNTLAAA